MTDLEITKLCAQSMGLGVYPDDNGLCWLCKTEAPMFSDNTKTQPKYSFRYNPLEDDGQAMELVKKHKLDIAYFQNSWVVVKVQGNYDSAKAAGGGHQDLNRAVVECVAALMK